MKLYWSAKTDPLLRGIPEQLRIPLAIRCHRYFAQSNYNRWFEPVLYCSTIGAVILGASVGIAIGKLCWLLGTIGASVVLQMFLLTVVSQIITRRHLRSYMETEDFQAFLREFGLDN